MATSLAVVLNELMQNAVDHAFPQDDDDDAPVHGSVTVRLSRREQDVLVEVIDDGVGLPEGFSLDRAQGPRAVDRPGARHRRARRDDRDAQREGHARRGARSRWRRRPRRRWSSPRA